MFKIVDKRNTLLKTAKSQPKQHERGTSENYLINKKLTIKIIVENEVLLAEFDGFNKILRYINIKLDTSYLYQHFVNIMFIRVDTDSYFIICAFVYFVCIAELFYRQFRISTECICNQIL